MENKKKTEFQYKLANAFMKKWRVSQAAFEASFAASYILPTGVSKTRIAVIIIKYLIDAFKYKKEDILIIVPTDVLKTISWPEEITKWADAEYVDKVTIECIQTVYQDRTPRKFVVADEIHNYLPNYKDFQDGNKQYVRYFQETKMSILLGLTAYIPVRKRKTLQELCPILYEMDINEALAMGFISNFYIYNVPVPLSIDQRQSYRELEIEIEKYEKKLGGNSVAYSNAEYILKGLAGRSIKDLGDKDRVRFGVARKYMNLISERSIFINQNKNKIEVALDLITRYEDKSIVFFSSKDTANIFAEQNDGIYPIHSGITKVKRGKALEKFSLPNSDIFSLAAVNAINEGVNVPKVKFSILAGGNGTPKDLLQRLGRNLRTTEGEKSAIFVQLYLPKTQDEVWMKNRVYKINKKHIINLDNYKQLYDLL